MAFQRYYHQKNSKGLVVLTALFFHLRYKVTEKLIFIDDLNHPRHYAYGIHTRGSEALVVFMRALRFLLQYYSNGFWFAVLSSIFAEELSLTFEMWHILLLFSSL